VARLGEPELAAAWLPTGPEPRREGRPGGTGRPYLVEGVGEDFWHSAYDPSVPDEIIAVSDADSFAWLVLVTAAAGVCRKGRVLAKIARSRCQQI